MAKRGRKYQSKRKYYKKEKTIDGFLKFTVKESSYRYKGAYVNSIVKSNLPEIRRRLEENTPNIFTDPDSYLFGLKYDDEAIVSKISKKLNNILKYNQQKHSKNPNEEVDINKEIGTFFRTRSYVSEDEQRALNIQSLLDTREKVSYSLTGRGKVSTNTLVYKEERKHLRDLIRQNGLDRYGKIDYSKFYYVGKDQFNKKFITSNSSYGYGYYYEGLEGKFYIEIMRGRNSDEVMQLRFV